MLSMFLPKACAYKDDDTLTVGHLPCEIAQATKFLMDRGAVMHAEVTSQRYRRSPLVQGGLEIPCRLHVCMRPSLLNEKLLERYLSIIRESYLDKGDEGSKESVNAISSSGLVDFEISALDTKAKVRKKKFVKKGKISGSKDIHSLFAVARERQKQESNNIDTCIDLTTLFYE